MRTETYISLYEILPDLDVEAKRILAPALSSRARETLQQRQEMT